jgi:hypothetical protein
MFCESGVPISCGLVEVQAFNRTHVSFDPIWTEEFAIRVLYDSMISGMACADV